MSHPIPDFLDTAGLSGQPWILTGVAGTQYHDLAGMHWRGADADLLPRHGEHLTLTRRPFNPHDENAIEVHWRSGQYMLGYIGRHHAIDLAPVLDAGGRLEAFAWNDELDPTELQILLAGDIPNRLHADYHERRSDRIAREAEHAWRELDPEPSRLKALWQAFLDTERARIARRRDAIAGLAVLLMPPQAPHPLPPAPPKDHPKTFFGAEPRPPGLLTSEEWARLGYAVSTPCGNRARAHLLNGRGRTTRTALWASDQVSAMAYIESSGPGAYFRSSQYIRDLNDGIAPAVTLTTAGRERCPRGSEIEATQHIFARRYGLDGHQLAELID